MPVVLGFDTATPATAVALLLDGAQPRERRHDPQPGERPQHASQLLPLANDLLAEAGIGWAQVQRIAVGVGPGTFTGLRIGVATARALAQASGAELAAISTLHALAHAARDEAGERPVLAVLDARRGEAFAAAWRGEEQLHAAAAIAPEGLAALTRSAPGPWLAVGDGAVRFRERLEPDRVDVPADASALHRVSATAICELALKAPAADRDALIPDYVRLPDAELTRRRREQQQSP
ncbi:MAG TPA: tRNA (adenosine(37)-N6)-threonylcarbamoyltransferase complex dimerization subunit type 1 TsaB [Solirubrobacteraceae bacterium]|nr:tRNA (adenosine(37)-N6)-threonylcarbamoyltransferase complex dimerization subunit type 1 TsaB [Solirubrobacteraceae bacterium]